jgi:hypothetical protein
VFDRFRINRDPNNPREADVIASLESGCPIALRQEDGQLILVYKEAIYVGSIKESHLYRLSESAVRAVLVACATTRDEDGFRSFYPAGEDGQPVTTDAHLFIGSNLRDALAKILAVRSRHLGN